MMKYCFQRIGFLLLMIPISAGIFAGTVDTVQTYSPSMKKNITSVIVKPGSYTSNKKYPVVYLLHGYGGNQTDWIKNAPVISLYADQYNIIIVCPDGNVGSWYLDSPVDSSWKYETYISKELVSWIDSHFSTISNRSGRAITGLSMGGHGALYLAIRHQDVYGAAGSMSGGVDLTAFPANWDIAKRLGAYETHVESWKQHSVVNLTHLLKPASLAIDIDCGVDDFFYKVNMNLHEILLQARIPHDFTIRPGAHDWPYWSNSVGYQLLFMSNYFNRTRN